MRLLVGRGAASVPPLQSLSESQSHYAAFLALSVLTPLPLQSLVVSKGGVRLLAEVLFGKHHDNEAAQRHALSALWNLAFDVKVMSGGWVR